MVVSGAADGRLEILPLQRPDVQRWRVHAFGENAPFTPTLLKVRGSGEQEEDVRGWTARRMAIPLIGRLGPRRTLRVLTALGGLREEVDQPLGSRPGVLDRKSFLRLGAGAAVAGGMLFAGKAPAFAEQRQAAAAAWVARAGKDLPRTYEEFRRYALAYRREIYRALPINVRGKLWREHLKHYRAAHPAMPASQEQTFARVESLIADDSIFDVAAGKREEYRQAQLQLHDALVENFGEDEAYQIVAALGPSQRPSGTQLLASACDCNLDDDWCSGATAFCSGFPCDQPAPKGCGWFWEEPCNGLCYTLG
ncbi:bacteriocin fulvocin C-related protein [Nonomuraea sp. KM90]|uniref:bacteriocin fulvocin C-related protein n=1 Tax=Nonomuraea sp. KM90 TaxID=3457428 RepID=UPI003FCEBCE9